MAFHLLSPGSRPYFSQAILQSAAATNPWAMVTKKEAKLRARRLAEILDCPFEDVRPFYHIVFCSARFCLCDTKLLSDAFGGWAAVVWLAYGGSTFSSQGNFSNIALSPSSQIIHQQGHEWLLCWFALKPNIQLGLSALLQKRAWVP